MATRFQSNCASSKHMLNNPRRSLEDGPHVHGKRRPPATREIECGTCAWKINGLHPMLRVAGRSDDHPLHNLRNSLIRPQQEKRHKVTRSNEIKVSPSSPYVAAQVIRRYEARVYQNLFFKKMFLKKQKQKQKQTRLNLPTGPLSPLFVKELF
jgi:hypothetical protein